MKRIFTLILSAAVLNGLAQVSTQAFTSSGNFIVPNGVTVVTVNVIGSGGSGGPNGAGGGGGGGAARGTVTVTPGASIPVVVGIAGGGSVTGMSSFGGGVIATGGGNGVSVANPNIGGGGIGGNGIGGNIGNWVGGSGGGGYYTYFGGGGGGAAGPTANGSNGGNTIAWTGVCQTPGGAAGAGGGAPGGNGGKGAGFTDPNCNVTDPSANGSSYGGGGGGANGNGGGPGTGSDGYVEVFFNSCAVPPAPVNITNPANLVICQNTSATLNVTSTGTVNWYTTPTSPNVIGTGLNLLVSPTITTTYYAEAFTCNTSTRTAITVTVNAAPVTNVNSTSTLNCPGFPSTLTASGASSYQWSSGPTSSVLVVSPGQTTTYTVTGTSNGCSSSTIITQSVTPLPSLTLTPSSNTICAGQSFTLTASGAITYSWSTTATGSVIVVTPTASTRYGVTGYSSNNCTDTLSFRVNVVSCTSTVTGIQNASSANVNLQVYPNPSKGELTISSQENMKLKMTDQTGRVIREFELTESNSRRLDLKGLAEGLYFITGGNERLKVETKVIVNH